MALGIGLGKTSVFILSESDASQVRADAVNTPARTQPHVLRPLDYYALSQDRPEDLKLGVAQLGASVGRCGNGAVVLNQNE